MSVNPCACSASSIRSRIRSTGIRSSAPISGGRAAVVGLSFFAYKDLTQSLGAEMLCVKSFYAIDRSAMNATAEIIEAPGMRIQFLIEGDQTSDSISIFRCDFEAGARGPMPHSHDGFDETVYG